MADVPNSYKDPYWSNLASLAEEKTGVPKGLLRSIMMGGEKSNHDEVYVGGARPPF